MYLSRSEGSYEKTRFSKFLGILNLSRLFLARMDFLSISRWRLRAVRLQWAKKKPEQHCCPGSICPEVLRILELVLHRCTISARCVWIARNRTGLHNTWENDGQILRIRQVAAPKRELQTRVETQRYRCTQVVNFTLILGVSWVVIHHCVGFIVVIGIEDQRFAVAQVRRVGCTHGCRPLWNTTDRPAADVTKLRSDIAIIFGVETTTPTSR